MTETIALGNIRTYILNQSNTLDVNSRYVTELLTVVDQSASLEDYVDRLSNHQKAAEYRKDGTGISSGIRGLSWVDENTWRQMDIYEKTLANLITGESRMMFRFDEENDQLLDRIFSNLAGDSRGKLDVLCVPCSSGKEAYSYAIIGLRAGLDIHVTGIDIQPAYVARAKSGKLVYHSRDAEFPDAERWLVTLSPTEREVRREVLDKCSFEVGDVVQGKLPDKSFYFIGCQNLLGYFKPEVMIKALHNLDAHLRSGGVLLLDSFVKEKPELKDPLERWLRENKYTLYSAATTLYEKK